MEYIVHHRCREIAACGERLNIPYGTKFQTIGEYIATPEGKGLCAVTSETAYRYFARNDDGLGLERGAMTWAIAYSPRRRKHKGGGIYRFSEDEIDRLKHDYSRWLRQDVDVILFNHTFFNAETTELPELRRLAAEFNIKVN